MYIQTLILIQCFIFTSSYTIYNQLKNQKIKYDHIRGINNVIVKAAPVDLFVDPSYNLAAGSLVVGTVFGGLEDLKSKLGKYIGYLFGAWAIFFTAFGLFIAYQTTTLRFKFDDQAFSLVKVDGSSIGENAVVGGENSWKYDSFVNYDFLPSESFPILVYFKETQTPKELWVDVPITVDTLEGQQHFFPCISDSQKLKENFISHNCKKYKSD